MLTNEKANAVRVERADSPSIWVVAFILYYIKNVNVIQTHNCFFHYLGILLKV